MVLKNQMSMAKNRFGKVLITNTAIDKVPYIEYQGINKRYYKIIQILAKEVLRISREKNDSNEVAITYQMEDTDRLQYGVSMGTEHNVSIGADTLSYHLLQKKDNLIIIHNHPSTQTFSYKDLFFFLKYRRIKMIVVVTNQGKIYYLCRTEKYNHSFFVTLMKEYYFKLDNAKDVQEKYKLTKELLQECNKAGIIYK